MRPHDAAESGSPPQLATQTGTQVEITRLDNGLTVVSERMPHLLTASLGVWVSAGARHETEHEHGLSHFLEHMAFKGTARRSAIEIAVEIEAVGGDLNAATSTEGTAYYARVLGEDLPVAVDVIADILLNPKFDQAEVDRERDVILQEIAALQDSPDDIVYDLVQAAAFPGQAIGRPIIGTPESVMSLTRDDLMSYRERNYTGANMVLAAAGAVDHAELVALAHEHFGQLPAGQSRVAEQAQYVGGTLAGERMFEQAHVLIALPAPSFRKPEYYASQVLSGALGGGMSSRLFQEAREQRGLCYSIYSSSWGLSDTGLFMIHAATSTDLLPSLIDVVCEEYRAIIDAGFTADEINRAKAQLKAGLMMSLESSSARCEQMARQLIAYGRVKYPAELLDAVNAVKSDEIQACAGASCTSAPATVAIVGAGPDADVLARETRDRFRLT
jgi:predicted Zn-dependent peptidase